MALTGTYSRSLDEKKRLAVPKKLCEEFGEGDLTHLYVAPGMDKSLSLYSQAGFARLAEKIADHTSNRADVRNYVRLFYSRAEKVELDSQGRIRIPDRLSELAGLTRDVVLLGVHDHVEIWDAAAWNAFLEQQSAGFDDMATRMFE